MPKPRPGGTTDDRTHPDGHPSIPLGAGNTVCDSGGDRRHKHAQSHGHRPSLLKGSITCEDCPRRPAGQAWPNQAKQRGQARLQEKPSLPLNRQRLREVSWLCHRPRPTAQTRRAGCAGQHAMTDGPGGQDQGSDRVIIGNTTRGFTIHRGGFVCGPEF